jgi:hypothetical protein
MNTQEQAIAISELISTLIRANRGVLTITLYEPVQTLQVNVLRLSNELTVDGFTASLETFTNNVNIPTTYDVYNIRTVI